MRPSLLFVTLPHVSMEALSPSTLLHIHRLRAYHSLALRLSADTLRLTSHSNLPICKGIENRRFDLKHAEAGSNVA